MDRPGTPWWVIPGLAVGILMTFAGALTGSFFTGDNTLRTTMATAAVNLAFGIGGYYFGSSAGSQKKDDVIANREAGIPLPVVVEPKLVVPEVKEK